MPQPLSDFLRTTGDWSVNFDDKAIENEPELALLFARAIMRHSHIEHMMGYLLIKILRAHAAPGYAMFEAISSSSGKRAALSAAAESMLTGAKLSAFSVAKVLVRRATLERNKLAHDVWGHSPHALGALIKAKSGDFHQKTIASDAHWQRIMNDPRNALADDPAEMIGPNLRNCLVYRKADFERILRDFDEVNQVLIHLSLLVAPMAEPIGIPNPFPSHAKRLRLLCNVRPFREERRRIREGRQKKREPQKR